MAIRASFQGTDIEIGFSDVQLILLMELADAQDVYTYPLPADEDITDQQYILAMQDLMVRGFVETAEEAGKETPETAFGGFRLTEEAERLFSPMFQADGVLEVISVWEGTLPVLIYQGKDGARTVSEWDGETGYIGITRLEAENVADWLASAGFLPEQPFETIQEAGNALLYDEEMKKNLEDVKKAVICTSEEPSVLWSMQENVRCVLSLVKTEPGREAEAVDPSREDAGYVPGSLCVFFDTETESWILTENDADDAGQYEAAAAGSAFELSGGSVTGETSESGTAADYYETDETDSGPDDFKADEDDSDNAGQWSIVPDSLEYRDRIWRKWL